MLRITRAPFFTATLVPLFLGASIAWYEQAFDLPLFLLTLLGALAVHAGLNTGNDYFDYTAGIDTPMDAVTPFSGGSRVIQEGIISAKGMLALSLACYALAISIGIYLAASRGWILLGIGLLGVLLAFSHNGPPLRLYYLAPGIGELAVGIGFGPVMVLGTYYVQTQRLTSQALWASFPVALVIAAVLYINQFPDQEADRRAGKKTLVVVLGRRRAVWGYAMLLAATYVVIGMGVAIRLLPLFSLITLLGAPLALRCVRGAQAHFDDIQALVPTLAATVQLHLLTGVLLSAAFVLNLLLQ